MNSSINPYEISKNILSKVISFKFQNIVLFSLLLVYGYSKFFGANLKQLTDTITKLTPDEFEKILHSLLVPTLNLMFFIGFAGILLLFILSTIVGIHEKKGWFDTFLWNYSYYLGNGSMGIFDNLAVNFIALPVNFGIILSGMCYFLDEAAIAKYYENFSFVLLSPYVVLIFYFVMAISFFTQKVKY